MPSRIEEWSKDFMYGTAMELDQVNYAIAFQHGARAVLEEARKFVKPEDACAEDIWWMERLESLFSEQGKREKASPRFEVIPEHEGPVLLADGTIVTAKIAAQGVIYLDAEEDEDEGSAS